MPNVQVRIWRIYLMWSKSTSQTNTVCKSNSPLLGTLALFSFTSPPELLLLCAQISAEISNNSLQQIKNITKRRKHTLTLPCACAWMCMGEHEFWYMCIHRAEHPHPNTTTIEPLTWLSPIITTTIYFTLFHSCLAWRKHPHEALVEICSWSVTNIPEFRRNVSG